MKKIVPFIRICAENWFGQKNDLQVWKKTKRIGYKITKTESV